MSPIPKPERKKTPVEKAIEEILRLGSKPPMLVVHPSDANEVKRLLEEAQKAPLVVGAKPVVIEEGPLMKAYREFGGKQVSGVWWDEQHRMDMSQLERDLEDSLWALADRTVPATPADIADHVPHMAGSETRIKRVGVDHVHILCQCKTVLRFHRCVHGRTDLATQCQEEVPVVEAGHALCVFHRTDPSAWLPGSRFFRCDYFDGSPPDGRCSRVATMVDADGRHWCSTEGHVA